MANWYKVQTPWTDELGKIVNYRSCQKINQGIYSVSRLDIVLKNEILLNMNFQDRVKATIWAGESEKKYIAIFKFKNEQDAVAFKLKWT